MNIVHVVEAWKGGIASYVEVLIRDQVARGYRVHLLADSDQLALDSRELDVSVLGYRSSRKPWEFGRISKKLEGIIRDLGADVVHCHSTFPGLYVRLRRHQAKVIYTPHSWSFFKQDVTKAVRMSFRFVERWLAGRCDNIVCMSMEEMIAATKVGFPPEKISLVYSGIPDLSYEQVSLLEARPEGPLKVGFFGRFDYQKGFDLLERAVSSLDDRIEVHLFGGPVRGKERDIDPAFFNHGWVGHKSILEKMASMDVIIIPSRWEGFALTPLEAMRVGKPVIVSNCTSLPEVVIHGFNGLVLSDGTADNLAGVLENLSRDECLRMGRNARLVFENSFRYGDFLDNMNSVYLA